jgi:hypothetical protein
MAEAVPQMWKEHTAGSVLGGDYVPAEVVSIAFIRR